MCARSRCRAPTVYRVNGLIDDCGKIVVQGKAKVGWFDTSTLKEPYRIEGKKTMGLELAEQLGWELPDVDPLSDRRRHRADRHVEGVRGARSDRLHRQETPAHGGSAGGGLRADRARLRRGRRARAALGGRADHRRRHPGAAGDRRFSDAARGARERRVRHRGDDEAITAAIDEVARAEGLLLCPEGAATYAALKQSARRRPHPPRRARAAVQLCDRPQISDAAGRPYARPVASRSISRRCDKVPSTSYREGEP